MIKVNLLPSESGRRDGQITKKIKLPSSGILPAVALLVLLYGAAGLAGYTIYSQSANSRRAVQDAEKKKKDAQQKVEKEKAVFEQNMSKMQVIEEKFHVAQALRPQNRIFWSEKINMIALARMDLAVYVTKLTLNEQIDELETEESVRRREAWKKQKERPPGQDKEPKPIKRPIINQTLIIEGIVYGTDAPQRLRQILAFQDNLTSMTWHRENATTTSFTAGMKPDFGYLPHKISQVGGVEVVRFGFVCKAEPQAQETGGPKASIASIASASGADAAANANAAAADDAKPAAPAKGGRKR